MPIYDTPKKSIFSDRRIALKESIKKKYGSQGGVVVLWGGFERPGELFKQNSTFLYFTGIQEAGSAFIFDINSGETTLFVPHYKADRANWVSHIIHPDSSAQCTAIYGINSVKYAGDAVEGYAVSLVQPLSAYKNVIEVLDVALVNQQKVYTIYADKCSVYETDHQLMMLRLKNEIASLANNIEDITEIVGYLRRNKDTQELEYVEQAIQITASAHLHALSALKPGYTEAVFQAMVEEYFIAAGAVPAYPSIIASGKNSTVLHYNDNSHDLNDGELLLVDIGASFNGYAADTTRTYPVNGAFNKRQKEVYKLVLEAQEHVVSHIKPGMWLSNKENIQKSLYHIACDFFKQRGGYEKYFTHGIGHFIGLDVHDLGDYTEPLRVGDIITIEPGLYIKEEKLGIRIEDMYRVTDGGVECLTKDIPKNIEEIEKIILHLSAEDENSDECCDDPFCDESEE